MPPIDCAGDDLLIFMEEEADYVEQNLTTDDLIDEDEPPTEFME